MNDRPSEKPSESTFPFAVRGMPDLIVTQHKVEGATTGDCAPVTCPHCNGPALGWTRDEVRHGSRYENGVLVYHCWAVYCWD